MTQEMTFNPRAAICGALLEALRARVPEADATGLPWAEAAARLDVKAYPWTEALHQPRAQVGGVLAVGGLFAVVGAGDARTQGLAALQLGLGAGLLGLGVWLLVGGIRKVRAART